MKSLAKAQRRKEKDRNVFLTENQAGDRPAVFFRYDRREFYPLRLCAFARDFKNIDIHVKLELRLPMSQKNFGSLREFLKNNLSDLVPIQNAGEKKAGMLKSLQCHGTRSVQPALHAKRGNEIGYVILGCRLLFCGFF